ncbi:leucine Rich repeat-containing domain protein, partial [human gut metagenome]
GRRDAAADRKPAPPKPQLNYLAEASKVRVTLSYGEQTIVQTLTLSSADSENAEYGIRSGKLKLLTGNYEIVRFTLFDNNDDELYNGNATDPNLTVIPGGLTVHDLTVNVVPRGKVRFTLTKDMSGFTPPTSSTRANISREYIFEEIGKFDVSVKNTETNNIVEFEQLPATFSIHFDDPENTETPEGYQTSTCACDSLLSLQAGNYIVIEYRTYDSDGILLETNDTPVESPFTVEDNRTTDADVAVTLYEADEYMKDHYALYAIWKALHGPEWSYDGENYPIGSNWNFDKDPDLWSYQPGVEVHTNGRIAKIDISGFGFYGPMPKELGQLTELVELYLGTHNDTNMGFKDPTLDPDQSLTERSRNRMKN